MHPRLEKKKSSTGFFGLGGSGTPASSRKVYTFSKWLTQGDQLELVQRDLAAGHTYEVARHRLHDGSLEHGTLVVGVTALSFLDAERRVVFVHPYAVMANYQVGEGQLLYTLDSKHKSAKYVMDTPDAAAIVRLMDKNSLVLERSIHEANHPEALPQPELFDSELSGSKSPRGGKSPRGAKSPRGGATSPRGPKSPSATSLLSPDPAPEAINNKPAESGGLLGVRYRVKVREGTKEALGKKEKKMVAVINDEAITLLDPLSATQGGAQVSFIRCRWRVIKDVQHHKETVTIETKGGRVLSIMTRGDAPQLVGDIENGRAAAAVEAINEANAAKAAKDKGELTAPQKRFSKRFTIQFEGTLIDIPEAEIEDDENFEVYHW